MILGIHNCLISRDNGISQDMKFNLFWIIMINCLTNNQKNANVKHVYGFFRCGLNLSISFDIRKCWVLLNFNNVERIFCCFVKIKWVRGISYLNFNFYALRVYFSKPSCPIKKEIYKISPFGCTMHIMCYCITLELHCTHCSIGFA